MAEGSVFENKGLFSDEKLASINSLPEWELDTEAKRVRRAVAEIFDRHRSLIESKPNGAETQYFLLGPMFHQFGYLASVAEWIPFAEMTEERSQIDYTLFSDVETFNGSVEVRTTPLFFQSSLLIGETLAFDTPLDSSMDDMPDYIGNKVNRCMLINASNWGFGTNGHMWRLYNRSKGGDIAKYVELDLLAALESDSLEDWKWFWFFLRKEHYKPSTERSPSLVDTLLAD